MGFKKLKEHYRIDHAVCVTDKGICIGSPYIHDLIIVGLDGAIIKADDGRVNEDQKRYMAEMKADPAKLREVVQAKDTFEASIQVYTYDGGNIIEKLCEKPGWPNVTHDGDMMYKNTYSTDKRKVVKWAKENAEAGIELGQRRVAEIKADLAKMETLVKESQAHLAKLEADDLLEAVMMASELPRCAYCGEAMRFNVPRLGPDGGYVHDATSSLLCRAQIENPAVQRIPCPDYGAK